MMFRTNEQIGLYTLIRCISTAGIEEVWLAERRTALLTTLVAVKFFYKEQVDLEKIRHEAAMWAKASGHTNVLPIIEADIFDGQAVLVSEYMPDGTLDQQLRKGIVAKRTVEILIGVLNGLDFLHARQIIHRNIKPRNIVLQGETPRLTGFGLSRLINTLINTDSADIDIVGTFPYMAPEVFYGKYSFQTDIWAVGIILYELLSGSLPFAQLDLSDLCLAIATKDPAPLPASIPNNLQIIVSRALDKRPENRYQSANEMRADLKSAILPSAVDDEPRSETIGNNGNS